MELKVRKIRETATIPTYGTKYSAGMDLYSDTKITIPSHMKVKVGTGISVEIPEGYFGGVYARSGLAYNEGLRPCNCVGIIDSDYRGEIIVALYNDSDIPQVVDYGQRIAQMIITPYPQVEIKEVKELNTTERNIGGFGSTGR